MNIDTQFLLQMLVYALSFGTFYGATSVRLKNLEVKMDKHNNLIDRVYKLEHKIEVLTNKDFAKTGKGKNNTYEGNFVHYDC